MKRYLLPALLALLICITGCAGDKNASTVDDLFKEFSQVENADYVNLKPWMMKMGSMFISLSDSETGKLAGKIKSVKVLTLDKSPENEKQRLGQQISKLNTDGYEELIRVNDNGQKVRILAKMDKDSTIRQLIVLCNDSSDCSLISVKGKFSKKDIGEVLNSTTGNAHGGQ